MRRPTSNSSPACSAASSKSTTGKQSPRWRRSPPERVASRRLNALLIQAGVGARTRPRRRHPRSLSAACGRAAPAGRDRQRPASQYVACAAVLAIGDTRLSIALRLDLPVGVEGAPVLLLSGDHCKRMCGQLGSGLGVQCVSFVAHHGRRCAWIAAVRQWLEGRAERRAARAERR